MTAVIVANALDPIIRYGGGEVRLTGWGLFWLLVVAAVASR